MFSYSSLSFSLTVSHAYTWPFLNRSHRLAFGDRLPEARIGGMELKFLRVPGIPRWSPRGEGSPRAQCQLQSTTKLLAQRGQLVQQFGGGVWGKGGQPLPSPQTAHLTQRILSELLAGRGPQRLFYREGLCTEYKSSSLTGLQHKLAPVTEKVIQNEGPTGPAASVQAS